MIQSTIKQKSIERDTFADCIEFFYSQQKGDDPQMHRRRKSGNRLRFTTFD